jgi:hypothetical protein
LILRGIIIRFQTSDNAVSDVNLPDTRPAAVMGTGRSDNLFLTRCSFFHCDLRGLLLLRFYLGHTRKGIVPIRSLFRLGTAVNIPATNNTIRDHIFRLPIPQKYPFGATIFTNPIAQGIITWKHPPQAHEESMPDWRTYEARIPRGTFRAIHLSRAKPISCA